MIQIIFVKKLIKTYKMTKRLIKKTVYEYAYSSDEDYDDSESLPSDSEDSCY
jgi:hypothetical protein